MNWEENYFLQSKFKNLRKFLLKDSIQFDRFSKTIESYGTNGNELRELYQGGNRREAVDMFLNRLTHIPLNLITKALIESNCNELKNIFSGSNNLGEIIKNLIKETKQTTLKDAHGIRKLPFRNSEKVHVKKMITRLKVFKLRESNIMKENMEESSVEYLNFYKVFDSSKSKFILIEGDQGMGKTVQFNYLLFTWANNEWKGELNNKLILKIDLSLFDLNCSIWEEIKKQNFQQNHFMTKEIIEKMVSSENQNVICLFDSFTNFNQIRNFINRLEVTTTIWCRKASDIRKFKVVEEIYQLRGFIREKSFFDKCSDEDDNEFTKNFETVINTNVNLKEILSIPQFAAIFFKVWNTNEDLNIKNTFEILNAVIKLTIHSNTGENEEPPFFFKFFHYCYRDLEKKKILLDNKIIDKDELKTCLTGLLQVKDDNDSGIFEVNFLHPILQTFFATRYLTYNYNKSHSKIITDEIIKILRKTTDNSKILFNLIYEASSDFYKNLFEQLPIEIQEIYKRKRNSLKQEEPLIKNEEVEEKEEEEEEERNGGNILKENEYNTSPREQRKFFSKKLITFLESLENLNFIEMNPNDNPPKSLQYYKNKAIKEEKCIILIKFNKNEDPKPQNTDELTMINKDVIKINFNKTINLFGANRFIKEFVIIKKKRGFDMKQMFKVLKNSKNFLTSLHFSNFFLLRNDCIGLKELFQKCSNIEHLTFESIKFTNTKIFNYSFKWLNNSSICLKTIKFKNIKLDNGRLNCMENIFKNCDKIENFQLSKNLYKEEIKFNFYSAFHKSIQNLHTIDLDDSSLEDGNIINLTSLLVHSKSIKIIKVFGGNSIPPLTLVNFIDSLRNSCYCLSEISFRKLSLNSLESRKLENFLTKCKNLKNVTFEENSLKVCFKEICKGLESSSKSLIFISISKCIIENDDVKNFIDLLKKCCFIEKIELHLNKFHENKFIGIIEKMKKFLNQNMKIIHYSNTEDDKIQMNRQEFQYVKFICKK